MSKKKAGLLVFLSVCLAALNVLLLTHRSPLTQRAVFSLELEADRAQEVHVFYSESDAFGTDRQVGAALEKAGSRTKLEFPVGMETAYLRIDLGDAPAQWKVYSASLSFEGETAEIPLEEFRNPEKAQQVGAVAEAGQALSMAGQGEDAYLVIRVGLGDLRPLAEAQTRRSDRIKNIAAAVFFDLVALFLFRYRKRALALPLEVLQSRHLIVNLAKNDFKTKFAGSYLGIVWAFIQPIVTVLVYWFVFQVGLRAGDMGQVPFVLYLIAGIIPWFYFQDALSSGTNALIEYSYLVKKVVFKISILPMVKLLSALFVHGFFVLFAVVLFSCYGYYPDLYELQIFYYTLSMFVFVLGICYATSAVVIFFRDLSQIITIVLQVGVWMVPIMWDLNILPGKYHWIFKLNPMYYIVSGYRDAFYQKAWFWQHFDMTVYFWAVTIVLFGLGTAVFKRLKIHFADVL